MTGEKAVAGFLREPLYNAIAVVLAIVLPALLVYKAWDAEVQRVESRARLQFEARAVQIREALLGRFLDYEQVLRGASGLFAASSAVDRQEWRAYHDSLRLDDYYPGIQAIGYSVFVRPDGLPALVERIRREMLPSYEMQVLQPRDAHVVALFIEPFSGRNLRALGFDGYTDPVRRLALERARDSGSPALSAKIRLAQETDEDVQAGLSMYVPVYRNGLAIDSVEQRRRALQGFVFGNFRVGDLMRRIIGNERDVSILMHEEGSADSEGLLFSSGEAGRHAARYSWDTVIEVLGQKFVLRMASTSRFEGLVDHKTSYLMLLGGIAMHLLLLVILWSLWSTRSRALRIAGRMTQEVRRREAEWQAMSDASPLGIFRTDASGRVIYANLRFSVMSGLDAAAMLGSGWQTAIHPDDLRGTVAAWEAAVAGQAPEFMATYRICRPGGALSWVALKAASIHDDKQYDGYVGVAEDVTERRQYTDALLKSRERLGMALEGSNLALFDCDFRSGEVRLSEQWRQMMGGEREETVTTLEELQKQVHRDDLPRLQASLADVLRGKGRFYEVQHRVTDLNGDWRWILSRGKVTERDESGRALRMVGTNADITAGKEVERLKSEFVATISHELRTPLTAIIGSLSLIRDLGENLDPQVAGFIDMAAQNSERLAALVNDVLDFEKIESGQMTMDMRPLQLRELLEKAVRINQPYADMHQVRLLLLPGPEACVSANADRLMQVLTNLISNAAKFSPARSEVEVGLLLKGEAVRVEVRDHGPGIPDNFRSQIFGRFERADNSNTRRKGGTGLGLAISKGLIEHMNGSIGFESTEGQGSVFHFELPLVRPRPPAAAA